MRTWLPARCTAAFHTYFTFECAPISGIGLDWPPILDEVAAITSQVGRIELAEFVRMTSAKPT